MGLAREMVFIQTRNTEVRLAIGPKSVLSALLAGTFYMLGQCSGGGGGGGVDVCARECECA